MRRIATPERPHWRARAQEFGFHFHTMYGEPYWDESHYYQFTLRQIEDHLEDPTAELQQMCLAAAEKVVHDDYWLKRFQIPQAYWEWIRDSWVRQDKSLYSRLDLAYNGKDPAKLYENNADTPTSLYESGFWQWLWLEDKINAGELAQGSDQFNSLQDKLVERLAVIATDCPSELFHIACCKDTIEDRGTVQYLEDCAIEAGIATQFLYVEDIGQGEDNDFTDLDDQIITWMFKLYPWEFMLREEYAPLLLRDKVSWLEPPWKAILSNKALMPLLWQMFPNHPNLLPSYFEDQLANSGLNRYVKKPIFAREGANVSVVVDGQTIAHSDGPYGDEGFIYQAYYPLPQFDQVHTLIGSWLVGDQPAGISVREDHNPITQDLSRYLPHIILD